MSGCMRGRWREEMKRAVRRAHWDDVFSLETCCYSLVFNVILRHHVCFLQNNVEQIEWKKGAWVKLARMPLLFKETSVVWQHIAPWPLCQGENCILPMADQPSLIFPSFLFNSALSFFFFKRINWINVCNTAAHTDVLNLNVSFVFIFI